MKQLIRKLKLLLLNSLRKGRNPAQLAMTLVLGSLLGIFPMIGISTILCAVVAKLLKLNLPLIIIASYIVFPLQIIMIYVFAKAGTFVFQMQRSLSMEYLRELINEPFLDIIYNLGYNLLAAIAVWFLFSILIYYPFLRVSSVAISRFKAIRDNI